MSRGYVYVIESDMQGQSSLPVIKIGHTTRDPRKRLAEIRRGSPLCFWLHDFVATLDCQRLERLAHSQFAANKLRRGQSGQEFFEVAPEDVIAWLRQKAEVLHDEIVLARARAELKSSAEYMAIKKYQTRIGAIFGLATVFLVPGFCLLFGYVGQSVHPLLTVPAGALGFVFAFLAASMLGQALSHLQLFRPNKDEERAYNRKVITTETRYKLPSYSLPKFETLLGIPL